MSFELVPEEDLQAAAALIEFGYAHEEDGSFVKYKAGRPREKWEPVRGAFLRFTRDDGAWIPVAFKVNAAGEGISGLDMNKPEHAAFFEWEYPSDYILNIYASALLSRD